MLDLVVLRVIIGVLLRVGILLTDPGHHHNPVLVGLAGACLFGFGRWAHRHRLLTPHRRTLVVASRPTQRPREPRRRAGALTLASRIGAGSRDR